MAFRFLRQPSSTECAEAGGEKLRSGDYKAWVRANRWAAMTGEKQMRKSLFVLTSTAILAMLSPAAAQYVFPQPGVGPGYMAPGYMAPGYTAPGFTNRGYRWREQRFIEDPRTNNAVQDRPNYETQLNGTTGSGAIGLTNPNAGPGECAKGFSAETCLRRENPDGGECAKGFSEETCRRRGQKYIPPRQN